MEQPLRPHEVSKSPVSQAEMYVTMVRIACMALLFEKETETGVRMALAALAQERHNEFHTKEGKKGDGASFQDCGNEICIEIANVLNQYKKPAIEFNQVTAEMLAEKYDLNIAKSAGANSKVLVSLRDKSAIDQAPILPDELLKNPTGELKIKL